MSKSDLFYGGLADRASSAIDRAVLIIAFSLAYEGQPKLRPSEVADRFAKAHLPRPNITRLSGQLSRDSRISYRAGSAVALAKANAELSKKFPDLEEPKAPHPEPMAQELLLNAPFVTERYMSDLAKQAELYKALHVQENSMRSLIERVLIRKLGSEWWGEASNTQMKRKHEDRLSKERDRRWLPARSELGPLYSIDWSDLITIIRKYESDFLPYIGEIDFMHRFVDMGLLRHVIAHNGFVADEAEFGRVMLALGDWNRQTSVPIKRDFGS